MWSSVLCVVLSDFCQLTLDTNTANRQLKLSDSHRTVTQQPRKQPYPDHAERFHYCWQLLCRNDVTGRSYWEVEWKGQVVIAVAYKKIPRRGRDDDCRLGWNDQSWTLYCSDKRYSACHDGRVTQIPHPPSSKRVAVYVDGPAGTLSFYRVSSDTLFHLHTFNATFTEPLYPAFGFGIGFGLKSRSSVSLCEL